jgi:hypothetical protein
VSIIDREPRISHSDAESRKIIGPDQQDRERFNPKNISNKKPFIEKITQPWARETAVAIPTALAAALAGPSIVHAQEAPFIPPEARVGNIIKTEDLVAVDQTAAVVPSPVDETAQENQPVSEEAPSFPTNGRVGLGGDPAFDKSNAAITAENMANPDPLQKIADFRGQIAQHEYDGQNIKVTVDPKTNKIVVSGSGPKSGPELEKLLSQYGIPLDIFLRSATYVWN